MDIGLFVGGLCSRRPRHLSVVEPVDMVRMVIVAVTELMWVIPRYCCVPAVCLFGLPCVRQYAVCLNSCVLNVMLCAEPMLCAKPNAVCGTQKLCAELTLCAELMLCA